MGRIKTLAKSGLTIIEVMSICIMRGVQPLQYRGKPMWHFNGEDDATRCGRKGPDSAAALAKILSDLYKERKRSSSALSHGMDSPCTTPKLGELLLSTPDLPAFFVISIYHAIP